MSWTLEADELKAIEFRAQSGDTRPADAWKLIGRVKQLEAVCKALESERDIATRVAEQQAIPLGKARELIDSGAPPPTLLTGLLYWLSE